MTRVLAVLCVLLAGCHGFDDAIARCQDAGGCRPGGSAGGGGTGGGDAQGGGAGGGGGSTTASLALSPSSATLLIGESVLFAVDGGVPPYTWSATLGTIDGGLFVATTPGDAEVLCTDSAGGEGRATVTVAAPLSIEPVEATLAPGNALQFAVRGGIAPFTFSLTTPDGKATVDVGGVVRALAFDLDTELVVTDARQQRGSAQVSVRRFFNAPLTLSTNGASTYVTTARVGLGDLDDVIVSDVGQNTLTLLKSTGDGGFPVRTTLTPGSIVAGPLPVDFSGDGHHDLIVPAASKLYLYTSDGDAGFSVPEILTAPLEPSAIATGAFTGATQVDFALMDTTRGLLSVVRNRTGGVLQVHDAGSAGGKPVLFAAGDFLVNAQSQLLVAYQDGTLRLFGATTMAFVDMGLALSMTAPPTSLLTANLDATLGDEVVLGFGDGTVGVTRRLTDGAFSPLARVSTYAPDSVAHLVALDVNRDGTLDVVAGSGNSVTVLLGDGTGALTYGGRYAFTLGPMSAMAKGQLRADAGLDLVGCTESMSQNLSVLFSR